MRGNFMSASNKNKLPNLKFLLISAGSLFVITLAFYFYNFHNALSEKHEDWGTFGDFMGGTLNPIFALFSLAAILYTIKIQTKGLKLSRKELKATRKELERSTKAQQEQSKSFKIQNDSIKLQSFENTFFQLMNLFLNTREHLKIKIEHNNFTSFPSGIFRINKIMLELKASAEDLSRMLDYANYTKSLLPVGEYSSYEAIKMYVILLTKLYETDYDEFNKNYEGYTGTYFIQIYQILKFINNSKIENKQFYVNLLRAQLSKEELDLLFYHCLGSIGKRKFKPLVEQFEFFEHLVLDQDIKQQLTKYAQSAYGDNESILTTYETPK